MKETEGVETPHQAENCNWTVMHSVDDRQYSGNAYVAAAENKTKGSGEMHIENFEPSKK